MTNYKNNLPPYAEEQIIQQKIKIPSNFIELGQPKKYWGSTEGLDKPLCERYNFKYDDKTVVLDISQKLIEKFGLKEKETCSFFAYINKDLLKKTPEEGGITVDSEKGIICQTEGIVLFQEREIQVDFTSGEITDLRQKLKKSEELGQETQKLLEIIAKDNEEKHIAIIFFETQIKDLTQRITELCQDLENEILNKKRTESRCRELERIIRKLREDEQVLISLQINFTQLQTELGNQIIALTTERDRIQGELNNLRNDYRRIRWKFLSSWFRKTEKSKKITDLRTRIVRLGAELFDKDQQITDLRNTINTRNQTIINLNDQITNLNTQVATLNSQKLTPDEQNAITWTQLCITAMNNALADSNVSYLDTYQSYFNPNGVFYSTNHYKYGRMNAIVQNLYNTWNQTRTQINDRNSLITNYQSQISDLNSQLTSLRAKISVLESKNIDNLPKVNVITCLNGHVYSDGKDGSHVSNFSFNCSSSNSIGWGDEWGSGLIGMSYKAEYCPAVLIESEKRSEWGHNERKRYQW